VAVERRVVDDGIDVRFGADGANGTEATFASVACAGLTTLGSRVGSVGSAVRGAGASVDATGAAIGAGALV
jgi:hypothetical protein